MKIIITKNKSTNKILPMLNLLEEGKEQEAKKQIKKQLIEQIINEPESIKAYKDLEIIQIGIFDNIVGKIEPTENDKLIDYKELFDELIEDLTKEKEKNELK